MGARHMPARVKSKLWRERVKYAGATVHVPI